jgi:nucleoside-diphosphate-sugar epimerase
MPTFLVFGATGGTGRNFTYLALEQGHKVRAIVRTPSKLSSIQSPNLAVFQGSITDEPLADLDDHMRSVDYVVSMLGDAAAQSKAKINTAFVEKQLVPAMRRNGVKRFLYQAGGLSKPYGESMGPLLWVLKHTISLMQFSLVVFCLVPVQFSSALLFLMLLSLVLLLLTRSP